MKFVLAPDSFKESMTAKEVCIAMEKGIRKVYKDAECVHVPMADGGEGTVQSLVDATNGTLYKKEVTAPLGNKVTATYGILGDGQTAIIEMAEASGLHLVPRDKRNPLITTTYGTGELIKSALDGGVKKILIGLGGSATNDGGAGMLQALGAKLLDKNGHSIGFGGGELYKLSNIDMSNFDSRISDISVGVKDSEISAEKQVDFGKTDIQDIEKAKNKIEDKYKDIDCHKNNDKNKDKDKVEIIVACDVKNPLTGISGASYVFGPQKGATKEMVEKLDNSLKHFAKVVKEQLGNEIDDVEGAGAAGGLGGALVGFCNGQLKRGIDIVVEYSKLEEKIQGADYVFTGEGSIDSQSKFGKTPVGVSLMAKKYDIPVIAFAGRVGDGIEELYDLGITSVIGILPGIVSLDEALEDGQINVERTVENIVRICR